MKLKNLIVRCYTEEIDKARVEDLERRCGVGPADHAFFTDTMGDPICRIRNSPMYNMLVAEFGNEIVGVIQGTIKVVTIHINPSKDSAKVGYILGLRVSPPHRHNGIGSTLVRHLEQWFVANHVEFAYMATEKDNQPSVHLFTGKLGFIKFTTPTILVHPIHKIPFQLPSWIEISKLKIEQAEFLYKKFMGSSAEFFPSDIDKVLRNKLSLGTWVAYPKGESWGEYGGGEPAVIPESWAMLSVWNSGEVFKLRIGKQTVSCFVHEMYTRLVERLFPWFKSGEVFPDFSDPFGFYFMYGVHREGPRSGNMVRALCKFVHNMASKSGGGCRVIVTEVGGGDELRHHIPHWKLLSCPEDLWCIKPLKDEEREIARLHEMTKIPSTRALLWIQERYERTCLGDVPLRACLAVHHVKN